MKKLIASLIVLFASMGTLTAQRSDILLRNWEFSQDSTKWRNVRVPHDWAIEGPFSRDNDLQHVTIEQNGETEASWKTGRTGGLPYIGKGFYKTTFNVADTAGRSIGLLFDGAMSHAHVYVNGKEAGYWPYGYNSFYVNLNGIVKPGNNVVELSLENPANSSRWYPGAGLYRNVHLIERDKVSVPVWGTYLTTPYVSKEYATINLKTELEGVSKGEDVTLQTVITDPEGKEVASDTRNFKIYPGAPVYQNIRVDKPDLWSPENPALYNATTRVIKDNEVTDSYTTRFGIRSIEFRAGEGFFLNGEKTKFKGVNNHHDLGPLGAAINTAALRYQLELMKDMGVNAIRTSHNMPAPELVALADEMGFMMMIEPFDDWGFRPKSENGYGTIFNEWAEKDVVNMVRHYRNNPSVVIWSSGNEVPSQWGPDGISELLFLQDIIHREDPTRPVTNGMDQFDAVVNNGFAATTDIPSFNYKVNRYNEAIEKLPQGILMGTETASTVSSRGKYYFPVEVKNGVTRNDNQSSSYDVEAAQWSNIPDDDFAVDDDLDYNMGQFVWTGFDYLGEPYPYDTDAWPSHSSYFGIIDLASIPKDRFYLYRSKWNDKDATLHILPHWNWEGREGEITPVFVYTDSPKAELIVNGVSQGMREKHKNGSNMERYRLMWNDVTYQPGELTVVAYDNLGNETGRKTVKTAGKPEHLVLTPNKTVLNADGDDLLYIMIQVADKDGNIVPTDEREVTFAVKGAGEFRATANGDPTSLRSFQQPAMDLFSGAATAIVQASENPGEVTFTAKAKGMKPASITLPVIKK
ncbi:MAG: DUF4982 domain-containing protein [Muribaculaceae bacterium]|nr:DUF4982 domain-containing protein [Muribaculaceae bacterium]